MCVILLHVYASLCNHTNCRGRLCSASHCCRLPHALPAMTEPTAARPTFLCHLKTFVERAKEGRRRQKGDRSGWLCGPRAARKEQEETRPRAATRRTYVRIPTMCAPNVLPATAVPLCSLQQRRCYIVNVKLGHLPPDLAIALPYKTVQIRRKSRCLRPSNNVASSLFM